MNDFPRCQRSKFFRFSGEGKTMIRFVAGIALALCVSGLRAEGVASLAIGDTQVRIAVPEGYSRASEKAPSLFAVTSAGMPPPIRLVETLMATDDLKRVLAGEDVTEPYVQVQVLRDAEALEFSAEEWKALQPTIARQLGATDLDVATRAMQDGMGARMGEASGTSVQIEYGEVGKALVYSQDGGVIRYGLRVPIAGNVNGQRVDEVLDCAGAALVLDGKLLMLNVYLQENEEEQSRARVRAFLASMVERAQALNADRGE